MASNDYLPASEAGLINWSTNFDARLQAVPLGIYGLDAAQITQYNTLHLAFLAAYTTANDATTRTNPAIVAKNTAKSALIANARELVGIIQENPAVTNQDRADLMITIRDAQPTPVPVPATKPVLTFTDVDSQTVKFILRDELDPDRKAKPDGVIGAQVISFIGASAPADPLDWSTGFLLTRSEGEVVFPVATPSFSKVWLAAYWVNPKGEPGPFSVATSTNLGAALAA